MSRRYFRRTDDRWLVGAALVVGLIGLALILSACGGGGPSTRIDGDVEGPKGTVVRMIHVDGVRCAVSDGYYSGGIDCDWPTP